MSEQRVKKHQEQPEQGKAATATLFSLAFALLLPTLGMSIANVALPTLADSFAVSLPTVNWVVLAYLIALISFIMAAGVLGDIWGRKFLLLLGIGIFSLASVICALSPYLWGLVIARLLQGVGATFILSQTLALASLAMPKGRVGAAMGLMSSTAAAGTALGPVAGGVLLDYFGWQSIFWLMFLLGVVSLFVCARSIGKDGSKPLSTIKHFDFIGTLLLAFSCLLYAISMTDSDPGAGWSGVTFFLAALLVFSFFLLSQRKRRYPLLDLRFFQQPLRNVTLAGAFVVDAIAMSSLVVGPFYLTYALALSPLEVGLLMSVGPLASVCSGYPAGKLVDKVGVKNVMFCGLVLMITGVCCFAALPVLFGVYGYMAALIVMTPGRQLFLTSNQTYVMNSVDETQKGLASAVLNLTKNVGLMTGASLMTTVFSLQLKDTAVTQATQQQLDEAFSGTFMLCAIALAVSLISIYLASKHGSSFETAS